MGRLLIIVTIKQTKPPQPTRLVSNATHLTSHLVYTIKKKISLKVLIVAISHTDNQEVLKNQEDTQYRAQWLFSS